MGYTIYATLGGKPSGYVVETEAGYLISQNRFTSYETEDLAQRAVDKAAKVHSKYVFIIVKA